MALVNLFSTRLVQSVYAGVAVTRRPSSHAPTLHLHGLHPHQRV